MSRLKVAVIGAGSWGRNHVRSVAAIPEADLATVCDLDRAVREATARQYPGVLVTDSLDQALDAAEAAVITTPAANHAELARVVLQRGMPVLVEKPFALSVKDAEGVAELAASKGVPVVVGHLLVFHPAVERLKAMISAGDLGEVYYLYSQRVNLGQVRPDENALWSFGPHDVSVALELLGQAPSRVTAHGRSYLQPGVEDVVFMTMEFATGVMAHVQMSWLDPHKERRLTVVGSKKMVVFDDMQAREKLKIYDKGVDRPPTYASYGESLAIREGDISIPRVPSAEPLKAELAHFVRVARGDEEPRVSAEDGVTVVRVLDAATRSLASGGGLVELGSTTTAVK
jgi:predicted dehydrogenase